MDEVCGDQTGMDRCKFSEVCTGFQQGDDAVCSWNLIIDLIFGWFLCGERQA